VPLDSGVRLGALYLPPLNHGRAASTAEGQKASKDLMGESCLIFFGRTHSVEPTSTVLVARLLQVRRTRASG
jgi:hypothetical protein